MKYVAFLRGINVGGGNIVPMSELKIAFEQLGYTNVSTLLNSGNVCFESQSSAKTIKNELETKLEQTWQRRINVIIRSGDQIATLFENNPFEKITTNPDTRLYVTFLAEKPSEETSKAVSVDPHFQIISATDTELCSVLTLTKDGQTTELMAVIEKIYGKDVTTRSWNTVVKIHQRLSL